MITNTELRERGMRLFNELYGNGAGEELRKDMADLCPDFTDISIEWAMGGILARPGLDAKTRELVVIASCVTLGQYGSTIEGTRSGSAKCRGNQRRNHRGCPAITVLCRRRRGAQCTRQYTRLL